MTFGVHVEPLFEHSSERSAAELEQVLGIELPLTLRSDAPWVDVPSSMVLTSGLDRGGQSFSVRLDLSTLPPGAHHARVLALEFDAIAPCHGEILATGGKAALARHLALAPPGSVQAA